MLRQSSAYVATAVSEMLIASLTCENAAKAKAVISHLRLL